ncbi:arginine repressor, partial [Streptomyces sp. SID8380]|nr:arginine repressor [Streptomyces sp. SID8380]
RAPAGGQQLADHLLRLAARVG